MNYPHPDSWLRLSTLFDTVVDLPPAQRESYIASACAGDADLEQRLRRMLAADAQAETDAFLGSPMLPADLHAWNIDEGEYEPGSRRFGAYRLIRLVGAGGMGEVHLAERSDGQFEQRVALKLLPQPTPGLIQRFRQERQILARLEHPNIARLLDGGVGEANVPYFAMEYVEGVPIDRFVVQNQLGVAATLRLFLAVCDAVQYAHRNLVVHRDIKPSNILVGTSGAPKLLDFGIAKVLQATDGHATRTNARAFTPDYAAPEQILGEPVTTATDVYALGVVLYELLTGARPYKIKRDVLPEQAILASAAIAPSAALARDKSADNARRRLVRGDLDTIVLHAIAKEPERRYATVEAFANDIRRHLGGLPIAVRGESTWYRVRKFARRNRAGALAAAVAALALIAATAVSLRQARIATEQAARAEQKSRTAEAVKDYLLSVFASANPYNTDGKVVTARDLLEGGLDQVDKKLAGQPQVQAEIYAGFVETFLQLGNYDLGKRAGEKALEKYRQFLHSDALEILKVETNLAQVDFYRTHFDGLVARFEGLLARAGTRAGGFSSVRADVLTLLGMTQYRLGHYEESVRSSNAAIAELRSAHATDYDYEIGIVLYNIYLARMAEGRYAEAAALISEFVIQDRLLVGPHHPGLFTDVTAISRLLQDAGRLREAHALFTAALVARRKQFPEKHILILNTRAYLADDDCELGNADSSEAFDDLIAFIAKPPIEIGVTDLARIHVTHAQCLLRLDRVGEARRALAEGRESLLRVAEKDSPFALIIEVALADIDRRAGNSGAALEALVPIVARQRERNDRELPASLLAVVRAKLALGKFTDIPTLLTEARELLGKQGRPMSSLGREIELTWALLPANVITRSDAAEHLQRVTQIACINFGCDDARTKEWARMAAQTGGDSTNPPFAIAAAKPYEAQYALAIDILAQAESPLPETKR